MSQPTLYQILNVAPDADAEQIRTAYRTLARQYHPDYNPDDSHAEGAFKAITRAYEVLSDPGRRARYDEALANEQKKKGGNVSEAPQSPIGRNETVSLIIFGFFLLLAIAFFFIDTPKGVFFLVIAVGLEIRNSIESVKRRQARG